MNTNYFISSKLLVFVALLLWKTLALAQAPAVSWQKVLGGSEDDVAYSIQQTADGGYIVGGYSFSTDGDVTGNHGGNDFWIVKLEGNGTISWQRSLGGSGNDYAHSIQQTTDGGYIVAGGSDSTDGDVTGNHGSNDFWIVKLDGNGTISWQKSLGGSGNEYAYSIQQTADSGYIVAGVSNSTDGDVTGNHGYGDYWIVKLDGNGTISWQISLGGSQPDGASCIQQTADGGYIIAGTSFSTDGNVTGNHGYSDFWIVKLDGNGTISWQKSLGGSSDDYTPSIQQTTDGGYIVAGSSLSSDGDVTGNHGGGYEDYWIVKLDGNGNLSWQESLGGTDSDRPSSIQQTTDGGYIVAGHSQSADVTGNNGDEECWIVKLDGNGNFSWQNSLGGYGVETVGSIQQTADGGYIVGANYYYPANYKSDYWIIKLGGTSAISSQLLWEGLSLYPNPNKGDFLLAGIKEEDYTLSISILDASGRKVYQQSYSNPLDVLALHLQAPSGLYFLKIQSEKGIAYQKFVVE